MMKKLYYTIFVLFFISVYAKAQHQWFPPKDLFSYGVIALTHDKNEQIWTIICNPSSGKISYAVQKYDGQTWITYNTTEFDYPLSPFNELSDIAIDRDNNIIVGGANCLLRFNQKDKRWKNIEYNDSLDERIFRRVLSDFQGRIWTTGNGNTVLKRDTVNGTVLSNVIPYHEVFCLNNNNLKKLYQREPAFFFYPTEPVEDNNNNIWVAYQRVENENGGLLKFDPLSLSYSIINIPSESGVTLKPVARTIHINTNSNKLYIGSSFRRDQFNNPFYATLTIIDLSSLSYKNIQLPDTIDVVNKIVTYKESVYIATGGERGAGLYKITDNVTEKIDFHKYFPTFTPWGFLAAPTDLEITGDKMWCATSDGIVVLDMNLITSVEEKPSSTVFKTIYPNPAQNGEAIIASLSLKENEYVLEAIITNALGQNVMTIRNTPQIKIPTQELASGVYFLHVKTNQGKTSMPFVVE